MAVFPESMGKSSDMRESVRMHDDYIRYMAERIEFAMRNLNRDVSIANTVNITPTARQRSLDEGTQDAMQQMLNELKDQIESMSARLEALENKDEGGA